MISKIKDIALISHPLYGIGTQQPNSENKGDPICAIYKITSPSRKIYIGQTIDVIRRYNAYRNLNCKNQNKLLHSFNKYGFLNHKFEVIHQCLREELNELEVYYIELFQCFNSEHGLNLKSGGDKYLHSEITKDKIRISLLNHPVTQITKDRISKNERKNTYKVIYNGTYYQLHKILKDKNLLNHLTTIRRRIQRNWIVEKAIDTPIKKGDYKFRGNQYIKMI
jgi:group I intron endonuclease